MEAISSSNVGQPLLTIAIPTYNRAAFLALCLKRISEELDSLNADQRRLVKVYVSNNASTDHTDQVVSQYRQMKAEAFEVVCNRENIGADRNITQCYASATTPYVWVLGDDDVILPGKLKIVLDVLAKQEIDILYVNGYAYSDSYLDEPRRGRGKSGVAEYSSALDFVKHTHIMLTFITALIVRSGVNFTSVNQAVIEGSNLMQMSWVFQLVRDGKKFAIIKDRIYAAKIGNSGGYGAIKVFGNNLSNITNSIFKFQPRLAQAIQNGAIVTWFPTYIMDLRRGDAGYLKEDVAIAMRQVFNRNWRYHLFLVPLISLPLTLARIYFVFVRLTRKLLGVILL
jgi:abequosyltransferase